MEHTVTGVGVLDKAMAIVGLVEERPRTLAELVATTGQARATVHRLATALEGHGLVARTGDGRFSVGPRLAARSMVELATPVLARLRDETGESVQLYVPRGEVRVCVLSLESPHGLRTIVPVGAALPMDVGSAAKVLAGDARVQRRGWAESVEEREKGVASVSAPIRAGRSGAVVAAVSVSGPVDRLSRSPGRRFAAAVQAAAAEIEASLTA